MRVRSLVRSLLTAAEEADVREMLDRGVEVEIRPLADDPKVDCASVL